MIIYYELSMSVSSKFNIVVLIYNIYNCLAFNDVAAHDIEWGEDEVEYNRGYEAGRIGLFRKGYVGFGLLF